MLVITRQIKAARSLIGWEQHDLASNSGVAISTVRRLERRGGPIGVRFETIEKICKAFEKAGIEFIGEPNPGVRLASHADISRLDEVEARGKTASQCFGWQPQKKARLRQDGST
jgi:transcriptional regulator with XRE-family HTH domain